MYSTTSNTNIWQPGGIHITGLSLALRSAQAQLPWRKTPYTMSYMNLTQLNRSIYTKWKRGMPRSRPYLLVSRYMKPCPLQRSKWNWSAPWGHQAFRMQLMNTIQKHLTEEVSTCMINREVGKGLRPNSISRCWSTRFWSLHWRIKHYRESGAAGFVNQHW